MNSSSIHIGSQSAFHMLRHFTGIKDELRAELLRSGRTVGAIEKELNTPGSRFHPEFAQDIARLLDQIIKYGYKEEIGLNGNTIWLGKADISEYPNGVGTLSVVSIDTISENERTKIFYRKNRGVELLHYQVDDLPNTADYTVILKLTNQRPVFITAFPGPPGMPLPDRAMEQSLYEQSKSYWENHVFLVRGGS
jgi:hypothetical protein